MEKLKFLLTHYARPAYRWLGAALTVGAAVAVGAGVTPYFAPVMMVLGVLLAVLGAALLTFAVVVLNVLAASRLGRAFENFEAAYDAYRRANGIADPFYEEADLAEAAARELAGVNGPVTPATR